MEKFRQQSCWNPFRKYTDVLIVPLIDGNYLTEHSVKIRTFQNLSLLFLLQAIAHAARLGFFLQKRTLQIHCYL